MANRNVEALTSPLYIGSGVNRSKFDTDGTYLAEGDADAIGILHVNLVGERLEVPAGTVSIDYDEGCMLFSPSGDITSTSDRVIMSVKFPYNADITKPMKPVIWFEQESSANIEFTVRRRVQPDGGGNKNNTWNISSYDINNNGRFAYTSGSIIQQVELGELIVSGFGDYPVLQGMVTRSDSNVGNIKACSVSIEYTINKLGI